MIAEICPHCGMSWSGMSAQYHCGTYPIASLKGKTAQSIACKEIARLRAEAGLVVVPELEGIPVVQPEFDDSGNKTHWNVFDSDTDRLLWTEDPEEEWRKHRRIAAHSVPASRILKDGEVAVDAEEWQAANQFVTLQRKIDGGGDVDEEVEWHKGLIRAEKKLDALRTQATATESGKAREVEG